jgi:HEAT repeat protein
VDDPRVPGALVELLHDPNYGTVSAAAARVLGSLGARVPLASLYASHYGSPWGVRFAFVVGIREHKGPLPPGALDVLTEALQDSQRSIQVEAAHVLRAHGDQISLDIKDRMEEVLRENRRLHASMAAREQESLAQFERTIEPDTPEAWLQALNHPEWETRVAAVRRLGTLGPQVPLARWIAILLDEDEYGSVQVAIAETLATLGGQLPFDATVVEALFSLVTNARDDPQFAAERALSALAPWLPRGALIAHLGDRHWAARETALEALSALGPDTPSDILVAAVGDLDEHIREKALEALGQAYPDALPPLAEEAREILGGGQAGPALGSLVRAMQAKDIGQRGLRSPEAIAELTELLHWPYWQVRLSAVEALPRSGPGLPCATHDRLEELCHDAQSAAVREAARAALDSSAA